METRRSAPHVGLPGYLGSAALCALAAAVALAAWNLVEVLTFLDGYRSDPARAAGLALLSFGAYAAVLLAPVLLLSSILHAGSRAIASPPPSPASVAAGAGLFLFGVGVIASRESSASILSPMPLLDLSLIAAASVTAGVAAHHLHSLSRRSDRAAGRIRWGAILFSGAGLSLAIRAMANDHLPEHAGRAVSAAVLAASLAAGVVIAWALGRLVMAADSAVSGIAARGVSAKPGSGARIVVLIAAASLAGGVGIARSLAGAEGAAAGGRTSGRPNVVVIVSDALRADRLGCYGAARVKTPNLDALAARGVRANTMYASASWTVPTTASLFTGLYPGSHGLQTYHDRLRDDAVTIASVFHDAGYATGGFSGNPILTAHAGFDAGFQVWDPEIDRSPLERHPRAPIVPTLVALHLWAPPDTLPRGGKVLDRALAWLDGRRTPGPFFLYVHFMDTHDPYDPPAPFDTMYGAPGNPGDGFRMNVGTLNDIMMGRQVVTPADFERMEQLYDGAVSYVDAEVGRLEKELENRALAGSTLLVFAADHGEEFLDHGDLEHTRTLYEEVVRIPLIVSGPGARSGIVLDGPVRQVDVAPTILEAAGLSFPDKIEGQSLWGEISRGDAPGPRPAWMELVHLGFRSPYHWLFALREGPMKLIGSSFYRSFDDPWRWELYDLAADPKETHDLARERIDEAAALRKSLTEWARRPMSRRSTQAPRDEENERRLRALGYID